MKYHETHLILVKPWNLMKTMNFQQKTWTFMNFVTWSWHGHDMTPDHDLIMTWSSHDMTWSSHDHDMTMPWSWLDHDMIMSWSWHDQIMIMAWSWHDHVTTSFDIFCKRGRKRYVHNCMDLFRHLLQSIWKRSKEVYLLTSFDIFWPLFGVDLFWYLLQKM